MRPLNAFSGWLMFLYVISIIGVVIGGISLFTTLNTMGKLPQLTFGLSLFLVESVIIIYFTVMIIINIKTQEISTPNAIIKLLSRIFAIVIGFSILEFIMLPSLFAIDIGKSIAQQSISFAVWSSYFRQSKRVKAYYAVNANIWYG